MTITEFDRAFADETWDESPIDLYFRLRREATMLEARAAEVLAEIDAEDHFDEAGYLSTGAMLREHGVLPAPGPKIVQ